MSQVTRVCVTSIILALYFPISINGFQNALSSVNQYWGFQHKPHHQDCEFFTTFSKKSVGWKKGGRPMATTDNTGENEHFVQKPKMREKVKSFAKSIMVKRMTTVAPRAIAELLTDATKGAAEVAMETMEEFGEIKKEGGSASTMRTSEVFSRILEQEAEMQGDTAEALDTIALAKTTISDAFALAEREIQRTEEALKQSKKILKECREDVAKAIAIAEKSALQANVASQKATALAAATAVASTSSPRTNTSIESFDNSTIIEEDIDISSLTYDDVDYQLSEMSPPFINEDQCLIPGEPIVRVEKAAENSRRIFAGIDIMASVDDAWNLLTDYENLQKIVPNLVVNEVVECYGAESDEALDYEIHPDVSKEEETNAIKNISKKLKGSKLKQVGGAKVIGVNFSAQVTLEVREWPKGIPFIDETNGYDGKAERRKKLERYRFPRPFAISELPTRDISMQSVENDDGEFRLYQGVWRMQPLPGCAPEGGAAMRLTYAVEVSPRPYLPVAFVEGRISQDLCNNLIAIRNCLAPETANL